MKIDKLETHDRYLEFLKQDDLISKGIQDCLNNVPDAITMPIYIFAHQRSIETDERISLFNQDLMNPLHLRKFHSILNVPTTRLIWKPRPRRPKPQTNSMLFRVQKGSDNVKIIWIIPAPELWEQYEKGKLSENKIITESIWNFQHNRKFLEIDPEELSIDQVDEFRMIIKKTAEQKKKINPLNGLSKKEEK